VHALTKALSPVLDLISQVLVAHLPHLGPNAWQLVLLLEALRRKTQFVADDDNSLSYSSLLSRMLLQDEVHRRPVSFV
jgi:hypothetical protein